MRRPTRKPTAGQSSLFGEPEALRIFVTVPSGHDLELEIAAITSALGRAAQRSGARVLFVRGTDAPQRDPALVRSWIRQQLSGHIDGVVELYGLSCGLGREDAIAAAMHLPRLLAARTGEVISNALGADGTGRLDRGSYANVSELRTLAADWFHDVLPALVDCQARRRRLRSNVPALRQRCLRAWEVLSEDRQRELARLLNTTPHLLGGWLSSDDTFAYLSLGEALLIAQELGEWDGPTGQTRRASMTTKLTREQMRHFDSAVRALRLDSAQAEDLLSHGREIHAEHLTLEAAGAAFREPRSPNSRSGWIRIWKDICGAPEN